MKSYDNFSWLNMREMEPIVKHTDSAKSEKKAVAEPAGKSLPETGSKAVEAGKPAAEPQIKKSAETPALRKPQNTEDIKKQGKPVMEKSGVIPSNAREIEKKETVIRNIGDVPTAHTESKKENLKKEDLSKNAGQKATLPQNNTMPETENIVRTKEAIHQGKKAPVTPVAVDKIGKAKSTTDVSPNKNEPEHKQHTKTGTSPIPAIRVGTGNTGQITAKNLSGTATGMQPGKAKSVSNKTAEKSSGQTSTPATTGASKNSATLKKNTGVEEELAAAGSQKDKVDPALAPFPAKKTQESVNKTASGKGENKKESKEAAFDIKEGVLPKPEQEKKDGGKNEENFAAPKEKPINHLSADDAHNQGDRTSGRKAPVRAAVIAVVAVAVVILAGVLVVPRFFHKGSEDVITTEEDGTVEDTAEDNELDSTQMTEAYGLEAETTNEAEAAEPDEEEEKIYGLLSSFWLSNVNNSTWTDWPQATNESEESVIVFIRVTSPMEMFRERDADGNLAEFEMEEDIYLFLQSEDDRDSATESHFDESWIELTEVSREVVEFSGNNEGKGYTYVFAYHCPLGTGESSTALFDTFRIKSGISSTIDDGENESIKVQVLAVPVSEVKRLISGADTTGEISEANLTEYYKYFYETAG